MEQHQGRGETGPHVVTRPSLEQFGQLFCEPLFRDVAPVQSVFPRAAAETHCSIRKIQDILIVSVNPHKENA